MNENDINNNTTIVVAENEIDSASAVAYYGYGKELKNEK